MDSNLKDLFQSASEKYGKLVKYIKSETEYFKYKQKWDSKNFDSWTMSKDEWDMHRSFATRDYGKKTIELMDGILLVSEKNPADKDTRYTSASKYWTTPFYENPMMHEGFLKSLSLLNMSDEAKEDCIKVLKKFNELAIGETLNELYIAEAEFVRMP